MWFFQNLNERPRSRVDGKWRPTPTGLPTHARASWSNDDRTRIGIEWDLWSSSCGIGLEVDPYGDHQVLLHLGLPPVNLYLHAEDPRLQKLAEYLVGGEPSDIGSVYGSREVSLRIFDWSIWWNVWIDSGGWQRGRPKWRDGNINVLDTLLGARKHSERLLERREIEIRMPEGVYKGVCELREGEWRRPRWPFPLHLVRAHFDMTEPIPIPGKGENSWDCGQDATHGATFPARSIPEAIGKLTGDTLRTREHRAGRNWRPAPSPSPTTPSAA